MGRKGFLAAALCLLPATSHAEAALKALDRMSVEHPGDPETSRASADRLWDGAAPGAAPVWVGASEKPILSAADFAAGQTPLSEPFVPRHRSGHYVLGDRCKDRNGNGRCDQLFFAGYQKMEPVKSSWWRWLFRGLRRDPAMYNTAEGVTDDLYARALVLRQGEVKIGLVVLDVVGLLHHDVEKIRARVADLGFDLVIVQATHNHSGPDTIGLWGPIYTHALPLAVVERMFGIDPMRGVDGRNSAFMERLLDQAAHALQEADRDAKKAALFLGGTQAPDLEGRPVVEDFRTPEVLDGRIRVLQARDVLGRPIATLANFAVHPEILGSGLDRMSADLSGIIARTLTAGGGGVGLHANGAIGAQIGPALPFGEDLAQREKAMGAIGGLIGRTALQSVASALPAPVARIGLLKREIYVPLDNKLLEAVSRRGLLDRPRYTNGVLDKDGEDLKTELDLIVLHGPKGEPLAEIFTIPGELAPEIYLGGYLPPDQAANPGAPSLPVLKEHLRAPHQFLIGLGNDELGYFIPFNDFLFPGSFLPILPGKDRFGRRHYEETVAASSQMPAIVAWNLLGMLELYYDGRTALTPQAVQVRARKDALSAFAGQKQALPALVKLLAHQPIDEVTPQARDRLLAWAPAGLGAELSKTLRASESPEMRKLLAGMVSDLDRRERSDPWATPR